MRSTLSARGAAILLIFTAVFQCALVLGAPWGRFTQGGQIEGSLPLPGLIIAAVSALLLLGMAGAVLARASKRPRSGVQQRMIALLVWLTAFYATVGVPLNLASGSPGERAVWAPVSALIAVCIWAVIRATRRSSELGATLVREGTDVRHRS